MTLTDTFLINLQSAVGEENTRRLVEALGQSPSTGVRRNPAKMSQNDFERHFEQYDPTPVSWSRTGLRLSNRPLFTADPLFHAGAYYVQEPSSMAIGNIAEALVADSPAPRVLDLCAAPGGKSTDVASILGPEALLVSNEVMRQRATVLAENIAKWGRANCVVTNSDPAGFKAMEGYFDLILIDAPCSGEGMFRKDGQAVSEWSPENVQMCAARQKRILADIWCALRPGGHIIYSTCTYNKYENDSNVLWMCEEFGAERIPTGDLAPVPDGVLVTPAGGWQFIPGCIDGEGFFCAVLRKPLSSQDSRQRRHLTPKSISKSLECSYVAPGNTIIAKGDLLKAIPSDLEGDITFLEKHLRVIRSGVAVATVKGRDFIPEADLALSGIMAEGCFPVAELSLEDSLKFLSKQPVLTPDAPRGYLLVAFEGHPLGFVKNLGNRTNNLHPVARRIKNSCIC